MGNPVIIGGAGVAGLKAAVTLRDEGIPVVVIDDGRPAPRNVAVIGGTKIADISEEVAALRNEAVERGVLFGAGSVVDVERDIDGVQVAVQGSLGHEQTLSGSWYLDATAGNMPALERLGLGQRPVAGRWADGVEHYVSGRIPADSAVDSVIPLHEGAFGFMTRSGGSLFVRTDVPTTSVEGDALIRRAAGKVGVDPKAVRDVHAFSTTQALVDRASSGRILLLGDAVAHKLPTTASGVGLAQEDAVRAAQLVAGVELHGLDAVHASRDYGMVTRLMHASHMV